MERSCYRLVSTLYCAAKVWEEQGSADLFFRSAAFPLFPVQKPQTTESRRSALPALALEIQRHGRADEIPQGRRIKLVAFVDVDGAPRIPLEAGVE